MQARVPKLAAHLDRLQRVSESEYEPPLCNVFSMQWFLTLFATCFNREVVYRFWDALMLEGSEMLLRMAVCIWARLQKSILRAKSADEFYSVMASAVDELQSLTTPQVVELFQAAYMLAPFPYPGLPEMREKYRFNIAPPVAPALMTRDVLPKVNEDDDDEDRRSTLQTVLCRSRRATEHRELAAGVTVSPTKKRSQNLSELSKAYRQQRKRQQQIAILIHRDSLQEFPASSPVSKDALKSYNHLYRSIHQKRSLEYVPLFEVLHVPLTSKLIQPGSESADADVFEDDDQSMYTGETLSAHTRDDSTVIKRTVSLVSGASTPRPRSPSSSGSRRANSVEFESLELLLQGEDGELENMSPNDAGGSCRRRIVTGPVLSTIREGRRRVQRSNSCCELHIMKLRSSDATFQRGGSVAPSSARTPAQYTKSAPPLCTPPRPSSQQHTTLRQLNSQHYEMSFIPKAVKQAARRSSGMQSNENSTSAATCADKRPSMCSAVVSNTQLSPTSDLQVKFRKTKAVSPRSIPLNPFPTQHRSRLTRGSLVLKQPLTPKSKA